MSSTVASKYLGIYLNDHFAGSTGGLELIKRAAGEHEGTPLGAFLAGLKTEIEADRRELEAIMEQLGVTPDPLKQAVAWAGEKAGRLKLNGELRGTSPLTPCIELEALSLGIEGKRLMWVAFSAVEPVAREIGAERLDRLIARAAEQREQVERHRIEQARIALA
jgi:hypothetical protein